jgi:hypothetical protein
MTETEEVREERETTSFFEQKQGGSLVCLIERRRLAFMANMTYNKQVLAVGSKEACKAVVRGIKAKRKLCNLHASLRSFQASKRWSLSLSSFSSHLSQTAFNFLITKDVILIIP